MDRLLAAVDIGTNSVLLIVAKHLDDGTLRAELERCVITRLGQAVDRTGKIDESARERTLDALRRIALILDSRGIPAGRRAAVGTSVLRDAINADTFLAPAQAILKCPIQVLSGLREAELVRTGVSSFFGDLPAGTVIFDVGGGSTELTQVDATVSMDIGAVRLTERHLHSDPPRAEELDAARQQARASLSSLPAGFFPSDNLIGIAGTVTTLASIELGLEVYDPERINGCWLTLDRIQDQIRRLSQLPLEQRRHIVGLDPARADVIVAGAMIVSAVLQRFGATRCRICDRGIRWGLLSQMSLS